MLKKLSIKTKIFCSFMIILLFSMIIGTIAIYDITVVDDDYSCLVDAYVKPLDDVMKVGIAFADVRQITRDIIIKTRTNPNQLQAQTNRLNNALIVLFEKNDVLVANLKTMSINDKDNTVIAECYAIILKMQEQLNDYKASALRIMEIAEIAQSVRLSELTELAEQLDFTQELGDKISGSINQIYNHNLIAIETSMSSGGETASSVIIQIILIMLIALIAGIILASFMSKIFADKMQWYEAMLDAFDDMPISATDMDKNITYLNKAALSILGKTKENTLGKNCGEVWGVDICRDKRCGIEHLKQGKGKSIFNVGDTFFTTIASYIKDRKGNNIGHVEVVSNVSAEHHKKQYEQKYVVSLSTNITKLSEGNVDIDLTIEPPGEYTKDDFEKFKLINSNLEHIRDSIRSVLVETKSMANALGEGNISFRSDISEHKGNFKQILNSMNLALDEVSKPLTEVAKVLQEMSTGNLTARMTGDYKNDMNDLKNYVNSFGESLTELIVQLTQAIHTTASATAEISATVDNVATAIQIESQQTDEIATAMEEMSRTVTENADSATKTANVAKENDIKANDGGMIVEKTVDKMKKIADVVKLSAENIAKLGESSKKINEIVNVINNIADQTNLLSLNAAIEAARAGEQGRGFAVVADSVGKLAVSTAAATKEIANMIEAIQTDTENAVKAMEKGTVEVASGIELADKAGNSLKQILSGNYELLEMINSIAAVSDEQSATSEEIARNITSISQSSSKTAINIKEVSETTNELTRMTETLTALISQFKIAEDNFSSNSNKKRLLNK